MGLFDKKICDICGEKIGLLGNRKLVHAETIHALFQPPAHHIIDLRSYIRVIPVHG